MRRGEQQFSKPVGCTISKMAVDNLSFPFILLTILFNLILHYSYVHHYTPI